jgi:nucleoside-diphosphate-sugar epimerase
MTPRRIILPGGSGFLGRVLTPYLTRAGYEVVVLLGIHSWRRKGRGKLPDGTNHQKQAGHARLPQPDPDYE